MFLQMNDNEGGAVHHSPTFRIDSGPSTPGMSFQLLLDIRIASLLFKFEEPRAGIYC